MKSIFIIVALPDFRLVTAHCGALKFFWCSNFFQKMLPSSRASTANSEAGFCPKNYVVQRLDLIVAALVAARRQRNSLRHALAHRRLILSLDYA
jgi:hypothetical protein